MKLKKLTEGVSQKLYHFTSFESATGIVKSNKLMSKIGQLSFSRSILGAYPTSNKFIGVIFEVDGQKLGNRYAGNPVGTERDNFDDGDFDFDDIKVTYAGKANKQLEDRLHTNSIDNFMSYVTGIYVFITEEYLDNNADEFGDEYLPQLRASKPFLNAGKGMDFGVINSERGLGNRIPKVSYREGYKKVKSIIDRYSSRL